MKRVLKKFLLFFFGDIRLQKIKKIILKVLSLRKTISSVSYYRRYSSKKSHIFFGYYDINPFNKDNTKMLYIKISKEDEAEIGFIRLNDNIPTVIGKTSTWNWQQGCRLRWSPTDEKIIMYNDYKDGRNCCVIYNIENHTTSEIDLPFYDISDDGKFGISLDFNRLNDCRPGYGYKRKSDILSKATNDKIILFNFTKNTYSSVIELSNLVDYNKEDYYFNHLKFSPDNNKFLFFLIDSSYSPHKASLYVYYMIEKKVLQIETIDSVSHYVWLNNNCIIATTYGEHKESYYVKYSFEGTNVKKDFILNKINRDGHPSIYDFNSIITDEYPDKYGFQSVYKMNILENSLEKIFTSYSHHTAIGEKRCDLHPRLNGNKELVQIDCNNKGYREIILLELRKRNDRKKKHSHYSI